MTPTDAATGDDALAPTQAAAVSAPEREPASRSGALPIVDPDRYEIAGEVGRGGLGRVLRARDRRFDRTVAVKELLVEHGAGAGALLEEALVTARLQHPSIVPVYDAGYFPDGSPFYSMKLVQGRTLADLIAAAPTLEARLAHLASVAAVAEAVAYAHSEGVIHRDLKPSNVVVGEYGETMVLDWGLAQRVDAGAEVREARGSPDGVAGTPAYMPPEQARGESVDRRADVYALGAILYHLLAGEPPYAGASTEELLTRLRSQDPAPLATRAPGAPPDLIAVAHKALARRPEERYADARELADDLRRFLTGRLVSAHHYSSGQLLRRWLRKRRREVIVASVLLALLVASGLVSLRRIVHERSRAEDERSRAEERGHEITLLHARSLLERDPSETIAWLRLLPLDDARLEIVRLIAMAARSEGLSTEVWRGHRRKIVDLALSPDGRTVASAGFDGDVRLWDVDARTSRLLAGHRGEVIAVTFSPDGGLLASASADGTVRLWEHDGRLRATLDHGARNAVAAVRFSADGSTVVSGAYKGDVRLWDIDGRQLLVLSGHTAAVSAVEFRPDGGVVSASEDGTLRVWSRQGALERLIEGGAGPILALALFSDRPQAATGHRGGAVRLWDVDTGALVAASQSAGPVEHVELDADGTVLSTGNAVVQSQRGE